jgi:hypothetical protein
VLGHLLYFTLSSLRAPPTPSASCPNPIAGGCGGGKSPTSPRGVPGVDRRHPRSFVTWASKLLLLLFTIVSIAAIFLLHGTAPDFAALLCLDRSTSHSGGPAKLPYPDGMVMGGSSSVWRQLHRWRGHGNDFIRGGIFGGSLFGGGLQ